MWKSNLLTLVRQKESSKNTLIKSEHPELQCQSKAKLPALQNIIYQWKAEAHKHQKYPNQSQLALQSEIDDRETVIKLLEQKVDMLESKLTALTQKHAQICSMLLKEVQKKVSLESTLRKQNEQLNKMLKVVVEQAKKLATRLYNKDKARRGSQIKIINQLVTESSNKQNINRINLLSSNKLSANNLHDRKRSRSRKMKLFSTRAKSKTIFSHDESDSQQGVNKRNKELRLNQIQRNYYKSSSKNETNLEGRVRSHKVQAGLENYTNQSHIKIIQNSNK